MECEGTGPRSEKRIMKIEGLTPILNVSNIVESFVWFEKLGGPKPGIGASRRALAQYAMTKSKSSFVRVVRARAADRCRNLSVTTGLAASG